MSSARSHRARRWTLGLAVAAAGLFTTASAQASVPIYSFAAEPASTTLQAGNHPDVAFTFEVGNRMQTAPNPCNCEDARNVVVHLPPGLIGNPHSTPQCTIAQFASTSCPPDSQVGVTEDEFQGSPDGTAVGFMAPVYNLVPPPTEPALLAFETTISTPVLINVNARTESDYGIDATVANIAHFLPLQYSQTVIWGVPASPVHNQLRFGLHEVPPLIGLSAYPFLCSKEELPATTDPATVYQFCAAGIGGPGPEGYGKLLDGAIGSCTTENYGCGGPGHPVSSNSPEEPFFQNPTTCGETSLQTSLDVLSYDGGETHAESPYPPTTDCNGLPFDPSQAIEPTTTAADSPSGAEFRLTVPQFESPFVPSPSELRAATVTFPPGFSFAPNVTNGKETCSDAQARFGTREEAQCPRNSKIGTLTVDTPVLPGPLPGAVYLGEPKPGNRFRLILAFDGFGVHVKLAGQAIPDPETGQIVITFQNLPQAPLSDFNMHMFGSERGPLDTPTQCGTYEVKSEWTPWDGVLSKQISRQFFTIDQGPDGKPCPDGPRPFAPGFQAASTSNTAGAHTAFAINITREDGDQNLKALNITTPPGFLATLKGVSYCPQSAIDAAALQSASGIFEQTHPSCPASSLIGEVIAGAGPGSHPLYLPGKAYLAGPYRGAPLSFVFITPAVSGGYDLGNVVVREGLNIDPLTAQVTTAGEHLPLIFEGIPLRLRQIMVNLNRPGFALNPTNCNPLEVKAEVSGAEGALSNLSQHFQVANCASLRFAPRLALRFTGSTNRTGDPTLTATLDNPTGSGYANLSSTQVTLPPTELIDNAHIQAPCTLKQFAQEACPPSTVIGFAKAETPLLEKPLEGPVYLRNGSHKLPDIAAALHGQIGQIDLVGHVDSVNSRLRATFETIPDAPVSHFTLQLYGAKKGLIENTENLCSQPELATVAVHAQNGRVIERDSRFRLPCSSKHTKRKRAHLFRHKRTDRGAGRR